MLAGAPQGSFSCFAPAVNSSLTPRHRGTRPSNAEKLAHQSHGLYRRCAHVISPLESTLIMRTTIERAIATSFLALLAACSFIVDTKSTQCTTTDDCIRQGEAFKGLVCGPAGVCVKQGGCSTNQECIDANAGEPFLCQHDTRTCTKLKSQDCTTLLADPIDIADDNTVWLGMMMPLVGKDADFGVSNQNAMSIALKEIKAIAKGLPPAQPGQPRRPLAMIACNEGDDDAAITRATKHMVEELRLPVVIGPGGSSDLFTMAPITIAAKSLVISPAASNPLVTDLPSKDPRLVWRTIVSDIYEAKAAAAYFARIEPSLRTSLSLAATDKLRVMTLYVSRGTVLENTFVKEASVNGAPMGDKSNEASVKRVQFLDEASQTPPEAQYPVAVQAALDFKPHVVLVIGGAEGGDNIIAPIEKGWNAATTFRPTYLVSDGVIGTPSLCAPFSAADARKRIRGFIGGPDESSPLLQSFEAKYKAQIKDGSTPTAYGAQSYDAIFLAAYGIAASGSQPLTGPNVARGLERVVSADPTAQKIEVGGEKLFSGFSVLDGGQRFHLLGSSGPLNFDVQTGETSQDMQITCPPAMATCDGSFSTWPNSGLYLDAAKNALVGAEMCP
jgi:ABC-type branched-subunit amino acid transport system substrate-binding protein